MNRYIVTTIVFAAAAFVAGPALVQDAVKLEYNRDVLVTPEILPIGKELRIPPRGFVPAKVPLVEPQQSGLTAGDQRVSHAPNRDIVARTPPIATAIAAAKPPARTYVVEQHDTLALIARKLYGDIARRYPDQARSIFIRNVNGEALDSDRLRSAFDGLSPLRWKLFAYPGELLEESVVREIQSGGH